MLVDPVSLHGCVDWNWSALDDAIELCTPFESMRIDQCTLCHAISFEALVVANQIRLIAIARSAGIFNSATGVILVKIGGNVLLRHCLSDA